MTEDPVVGCVGKVITATSGVAPHEAGIASGIVNTARMFGGALGLAILATIATSHSNGLLHHPAGALPTPDAALVSGFQLAFLVGAGMAFIGTLVAIFAVPNAQPRAATTPAAVPVVEL